MRRFNAGAVCALIRPRSVSDLISAPSRTQNRTNQPKHFC